jgi:uncharacterized membrane protein YfhO
VHRDDAAAIPGLAALQRETATPSVAPATNYRLTSNTTSFDVRASGPGIVVLTEAWWPETFRATIDGRRVPIVRVNHAFKGVIVDRAGDHRITFRYWPRNLTRNLILSAVGLGLGLVSLLLALRPIRLGTQTPRPQLAEAARTPALPAA